MNKRDHGGNIHAITRSLDTHISGSEILDFSANINPLGFPDSLRPLVSYNLESLLHYPDQEYTRLRQSFAKKHGLPMEYVWPGNGASELIFHLPRISAFNRCIIPVPCYSDYLYAARASGIPVFTLTLDREAGFCLNIEKLKAALDPLQTLVFLGQPSNPVGTLIEKKPLLALAQHFPDTLFCIDESFADYVPDYISLARDLLPNMAVIRSMTKTYAVPGLRLGYVVAYPEVITELRNLLPTWSVNALAAALGPELLTETSYLEKTIIIVENERKKLFKTLTRYRSFCPYPSHANYLTIEIKNRHRDSRKHSSPNSGFPEAAVAGALGIRLGGPTSYFGEISDKPFIGDSRTPLSIKHIKQTCRVTGVLVVLVLLACSLYCILAFFL